MSDDPTLGFGKFVPGFDFLQNIAKGAGQAMPNLTNWVAPTLSVEELDKRIGELKAVHFWLEQNSKALGATIQALEVQKMTLATLKGMNFNMAEVASALTLKPAEAKEARPAKEAKDGNGAAAATGVVDPLQWWGALTQQFQQIAAGALKDAANNTAMDTARNMAAGMARDAVKNATDVVQAATGVATGAVRKSAAGKSVAAKPATKKTTRKAPTRKRSASTSK
jgi:hypothetical protein